MLRPIVVAVVMSLFSGSLPAVAQNFKGSCEKFCREKRCAAGSASHGMASCMSICVPNSRMKNPNAK
jgi:hypothetical protein